MSPRGWASRKRRQQGGKQFKAQQGGKTFRANRPPAGVKFKLLNVESISTKFSHKALTRSNHSWAAIKETPQYPTLKKDAEKLYRGEDLGDMYSLYMLVGDDIVCQVTFIPNVHHKYTRVQVTYEPRGENSDSDSDSDSNSNSNSNSDSNSNSESNSNSNSNSDSNVNIPHSHPPHVSTQKKLPQSLGYIDYLTCAKGAKAYSNFPHKPASHYVLYQAFKLIQKAGSKYATLIVAAEEPSPSSLYLFYKKMGFACAPLDKVEYRSNFPFLFARKDDAGRRAHIQMLRTNNPYLEQQERKAAKNRNKLETYLKKCSYMVGSTDEILIKLTETVKKSWPAADGSTTTRAQDAVDDRAG